MQPIVNLYSNSSPSRSLLPKGIGLTLLLCCLLFSNCKKVPPTDNPPVTPLFLNSIVSTDIDFIETGDPDAFTSLTYTGLEDKEMPDSRTDDLFDTNTFIFDAAFSNGKIVEIWAHSSFGNQAAAQEYADKLTSRLGKLPEFMRDELSHVVVHKGDAGAFSEALGNFMVLYSDNMDTRIANHDLEETVFHETVHASLDAIHASSADWKAAQNADGTFITDYAEEYPGREDLAESALFVYTLLTYPGRMPSEVEAWISEHIPNRLSFLRTIFL